METSSCSVSADISGNQIMVDWRDRAGQASVERALGVGSMALKVVSAQGADALRTALQRHTRQSP